MIISGLEMVSAAVLITFPVAAFFGRALGAVVIGVAVIAVLRHRNFRRRPLASCRLDRPHGNLGSICAFGSPDQSLARLLLQPRPCPRLARSKPSDRAQTPISRTAVQL